jgi:hypothetical protein
VCSVLFACQPEGPSGSTYPGVAYDGTNGRFLAVSVKLKSGYFNENTTRLYGVFIDSNGAPPGREFTIAEGDSFHCPSLVFDKDHGKYLVVWNANTSMLAQFINADGTPGGPILTLSDTAEPPALRCSSVAYDPAQGKFLAAWGEKNPDNHDSLYARLISADGSFDGPKLLISDDGATPSRLSIAYDSVNLRYLVVWDNFCNREIKGRFINPDGSFVAPEFSIFSSGSVEFWPKAVFDSANARFLVTSEHLNTDTYVLLGQLLNADGTSFQSVFTISSSPLSVLGHSSVFDPVGQNFFVVFGDYTAEENQKIHGQVISAAGPPSSSAPSDNILLSYVDFGGDRRPSVAYDSVNQRFFAAWSYGSDAQQMSDIHGRHLNADGTPSGDIFILSNGGSWE